MSKTEETVIPFETVRVPDGDKPKGFEQVISDGVDGKRTVTYSDSGQVLSDRTKHAKNKVVYFGTKEEGEQTDSLSTGDAADVVQGNSTETVPTPDSPQDESEKDTSEKDESDEKSFQPAETYKSNQKQGRFSKLRQKNEEEEVMNSTALKKAALEFARLLVFAIPGILITVLSNNPELGGAYGALILGILKSVDRGIHEDPSTEAKGLLPF